MVRGLLVVLVAGVVVAGVVRPLLALRARAAAVRVVVAEIR